jgi:hypothetical protein
MKFKDVKRKTPAFLLGVISFIVITAILTGIVLAMLLYRTPYK